LEEDETMRCWRKMMVLFSIYGLADSNWKEAQREMMGTEKDCHASHSDFSPKEDYDNSDDEDVKMEDDNTQPNRFIIYNITGSTACNSSGCTTF
jgi:hypothetical protein